MLHNLPSVHVGQSVLWIRLSSTFVNDDRFCHRQVPGETMISCLEDSSKNERKVNLHVHHGRNFFIVHFSVEHLVTRPLCCKTRNFNHWTPKSSNGILPLLGQISDALNCVDSSNKVELSGVWSYWSGSINKFLTCIGFHFIFHR